MPELLIAVMIITVKRIKTTIAPMTMKMLNQSVTELMAVVVLFITLDAAASEVEVC